MNIAKPSQRITKCPTFTESQLKGCDLVGTFRGLSYSNIIERRIAVASRRLAVLLSVVSFRNVYPRMSDAPEAG